MANGEIRRRERVSHGLSSRAAVIEDNSIRVQQAFQEIDSTIVGVCMDIPN